MKIESVLVVDPAPRTDARLLSFLESVPEVHRVRSCRTPDDAFTALREEETDLVFLDVRLLDDACVAAGDRSPWEEIPPAVFLSDSAQDAVRAFECNAVDFLVRPVGDDRFRQAFERARLRIGGQSLTRARDGLEGVLEVVLRYRRPPGYLIVEKGERMEVLPTARIDWMESEGNYVRLHRGDATFLVRGTLTSILQRLESERFLQIHRAYAARVESIREIRKLFNGRLQVVLRDGTELPVSRRYARRLPVIR